MLDRGIPPVVERPGDDSAHEARARALVAIGRLDEAELEAQSAVRLDPDEVRYRELLAEILSARGSHRDAAAEYLRLAVRDPRQASWIRAVAVERMAGGEAGQAAEAARAALRLDAGDGVAALTLTRALVELGIARQALVAAARLAELLPGDPDAREAWADAHALAGEGTAAFAEYAALMTDLSPADPRRRRVEARARALYGADPSRRRRWLAALPWLFGALFRAGRLRLW